MASAKRLLYILLKAKVFLHLNNRMIQTQVFLWAAAAEILHITLKSYKAITHFSSLTRDISDLNRMFFVCKCSVHKVLAQCYCATRAYILWGAIKMMAHTASCKNRAIIQLSSAAYCCCCVVVMVHQLMLDLQKQANRWIMILILTHLLHHARKCMHFGCLYNVGSTAFGQWSSRKMYMADEL